jgi:phosphoribosylformylglycinamidine synthase
VGAKPDSLTDCLNFGNPEKPEQLYDFQEVVKGMGDIAKYLKIPFPSGNVSFYNESAFSVVPPTAVVLGVGIVDDIRKCVTTDLKSNGDLLFQIGATGPEMGGSEYYAVMGGVSADVPGVEKALLKRSVDALVKAIDKGMVAASHDIATGGLAVTLAEMCIGGDIGCKVDLSKIDAKDGSKIGTRERLFAETNTRWVVAIPEGKKKAFINHMKKAKVPTFEIGKVGGDHLDIKAGKQKVTKLNVSKIRDVWSQAFSKMLG